MNSKMVIERDQAARAVVTGAAVHGESVAAALCDRLAAGLAAGEAMPDFGLAIRLVAGGIERHRQVLVAADAALQLELLGLADLCRRRDAAVAQLRRLLAGLRSTAKGTYGSDWCGRRLRLAGAVPTDPGALLLQVQQVLHILSDPRVLEVPESARLVAGVSLDPEALRAQFEGPAAALDEALTAAEVARRGKEATQAERQKALAAHDAAFQAGIRLLEALFGAAGMPDLAARLRPRRSPRPPTPVRPSPARR